jgi:hypothetical protein
MTKARDTANLMADGAIGADELASTLDLSGKTLTLPAGTALPSQSGQNGNFLTTDGSSASWSAVDALPSQSGQSGKYLTTDGSTASWDVIDTSAAGNDTELQYNNSGARAGASGLVTDGSNLTIKTQADIRFGDADDSNYVALQGPATVASNVTWTLPNADGSSGQSLVTNGSGTLSWASGGTPGPFSDGTAGSPSITFSADTNTGFFRATTDQFCATAGGNERARITSQEFMIGRSTSVSAANTNLRFEALGQMCLEGGATTQNDVTKGMINFRADCGSGSNTEAWANFYPGVFMDVVVESGNNGFANSALMIRGQRGAAISPGCFIRAGDGNKGSSSFTQRFRVNIGGDVANSNNSYGSLSDVRLKQDITDASSQWDDIKAVRIRKYRMKSDFELAETINEANPDANWEPPYYLGAIAQELEEISPGLIEHEGGEENMKVIKYSILYMKAIKALQEAMERIETLEAKVAALENA